jgi:hypothetical protein
MTTVQAVEGNDLSSRGAAMECSTIESCPNAAPPDLDSLEAHVQCRVGGRVLHFRLDVCDGGLILRGHSLTYYAKQLAQHAVMAATNLPIRANEIEVL